MNTATLGWHISERGYREAADRHQFGRGVRIAMLDTGIEASHAELRSQRIECLDVTARNGIGQDRSGHGTNIGSVLVGRRVGIAPQAELVSIKIACGRRPATETNILTALDVCGKYNVDLIHMSYGSTKHYPAIQRAIEALSRQGIVTVASAGLNRNGHRVFPGSYANVLGVASLTRDCSGFQQSPCPNVRFAEVGQDVMTGTLNGHYRPVSGSSIAAAITSGIVALWLASGGAGPKTDRLMGCSQLDWLLCTAEPCHSLPESKIVMLSPARLLGAETAGIKGS